MELPETRYARSGKVSIAYQILGSGPLDLVFVPGLISNVEYAWQQPAIPGTDSSPVSMVLRARFNALARSQRA